MLIEINTLKNGVLKLCGNRIVINDKIGHLIEEISKVLNGNIGLFLLFIVRRKKEDIMHNNLIGDLIIWKFSVLPDYKNAMKYYSVIRKRQSCTHACGNLEIGGHYVKWCQKNKTNAT